MFPSPESEEWMGEGGAGCVPAGPAVHLTLKVAGVHWWYRTRSHAAELTAGGLCSDVAWEAMLVWCLSRRESEC